MAYLEESYSTKKPPFLDEDSNEELNKIFQRFKKFHSGYRKNPSPKGKYIKSNEVLKEEIKCDECDGFGHLAMECPNHLEKYKKKDMIATWDDSDESKCESQSSEGRSSREVQAFMACGSLKDSLISESKSDEEEGEDEEDIQYVFNKLYEEKYRVKGDC